jgi:hypothetical protein
MNPQKIYTLGIGQQGVKNLVNLSSWLTHAHNCDWLQARVTVVGRHSFKNAYNLLARRIEEGKKNRKSD